MIARERASPGATSTSRRQPFRALFTLTIITHFFTREPTIGGDNIGADPMSTHLGRAARYFLIAGRASTAAMNATTFGYAARHSGSTLRQLSS